MSRIFISYRRSDSAMAAGRLYDHLSSHFGNDLIFMDVDTIELGEDFVEVLQTAVSACDALIAVIGSDWLTVTNASGQRRLDNPHDFVRLEIATALERNIRVIPVLVDDALMPIEEDLPEPLRRLTRRNALSISNQHFRHDTGRLIETLERVTNATPKSLPASATTQRSSALAGEALFVRTPSWFNSKKKIYAATIITGIVWALTMAVTFHFYFVVHPYWLNLQVTLMLIGCIGGGFTGLIMRWIRPAINWKVITTMTLSWGLAYLAIYGGQSASFEWPFLLMASLRQVPWQHYYFPFIVQGAVVGLVPGHLLLRSPKWKLMVIFSWAFGWIVGITAILLFISSTRDSRSTEDVSQNVYPLIGFVGAAMMGLCGGGVTAWSLEHDKEIQMDTNNYIAPEAIWGPIFHTVVICAIAGWVGTAFVAATTGFSACCAPSDAMLLAIFLGAVAGLVFRITFDQLIIPIKLYQVLGTLFIFIGVGVGFSFFNNSRSQREVTNSIVIAIAIIGDSILTWQLLRKRHRTA